MFASLEQVSAPVATPRELAGIAALALFAAAPGLSANWWDARTVWVGVVHDTQALDSTGTPRQALAAGTLVVREAAPVWAGRILVRLGDGTRAYVVVADVTP